jgi:hypothetical protein
MPLRALPHLKIAATRTSDNGKSVRLLRHIDGQNWVCHVLYIKSVIRFLLRNLVRGRSLCIRPKMKDLLLLGKGREGGKEE